MTFQDLVWLREQALQRYNQLRIQDARMDGGPSRDLSYEEARFLAIFDASVALLSRQGKLTPEIAAQDHLGLRYRNFESTFEEG